MRERQEHFIYHGTFQSDCSHCWDDMHAQREQVGLGLTVAAPTFRCDRCGKEGCSTGGQYRRLMLCFDCYKRYHAKHWRFVEYCYLCQGGRFSAD